jgi:hypothetical protein
MISRRAFLGGAALTLIASRTLRARQPETLYNGITLGRPWPPRWRYADEHPTTPPYLADRPDVVPIDVGRQLFVDDFLIEDTTMSRVFHHAAYHPASPVVKPEHDWEHYDDLAARTNQPFNPAAMVFSDGVFFDPKDRLFKMWYMAGYGGSTCLALSRDGIKWEKPSFDAIRTGTNLVHKHPRDSNTIWLDQFTTDPAQRYKMAYWHDHKLVLAISPDGIHWKEIGESGRAGDRSTFFFNPFRRQWVFSVRADQFAVQSQSGRFRRYWEAADFKSAINWSGRDPVAWVKSDSRDPNRPDGGRPELYTLDCVGYESLVLGLFSIWRGETLLREKINDIAIGFSRDGFHWHRPDRSTFIGVSDQEGAWNWANVQSAGGCCLVVGDNLYFYVSGRQGRPGTADPGVCSTGLAVLRRDGFASMDWMPGEGRIIRGRIDNSAAGTLTTRPVKFSGGHLFVNGDFTQGELRVEVLDRSGRVIAPFTSAACEPMTGNGTRLAIKWNNARLGDVAGREVRFRFTVTRGRLFAFWVSAKPTGQSGGYPAAGGPEFSGPIDA